MVSSGYAARTWSTAARTRNDGLPLSFGVLYPRNAVVAVMDNERRAEQGARALSQAGIGYLCVDVLSGPAFVAMLAEAKRRRGIVGRLAARLSRLLSDDAAYEQSLIDAARRQHALLIVHTADSDLAARVPALLRGYGAHDVRYYRRGTIEDLI